MNVTLQVKHTFYYTSGFISMGEANLRLSQKQKTSTIISRKIINYLRKVGQKEGQIKKNDSLF